MRFLLFSFAFIIVAMLAYTTIAGEKLVKEDGTISSTSLPLDKETSQVAYETATFGIG